MRPDEFADHLRACVDPKWIRPPASARDIAAVEERLGIRVSPEMRAFYEAVGGCDAETPPVRGWMTFWPLERWERATTVDEDDGGDLILVADYSLSSWWYAVRPSGDPDTPVLIVGGETPRVVASSFSSFIDAVFKNDRSIYPD